MKKNLFWIFALNAAIYWLQDFEGIAGFSLFRHFKEDLHFSPEKIMVITSLLGLAWIPKILWGVLIDNYFSKRLWIAFTLIVDFITVLFLGIWSLPLIVLLTCLFFQNSNSALRDVTADAIMCVEGKKRNLTGKIQSIQWIALTLSAIVTSLLGGYIADHYSYKIGFLLILPFYLLCVIPLLFYKERKKENFEPSCRYCKFNVECSGDENGVCESYQERYVSKSLVKTIKPYKELFKNKSFLTVSLFIFLYVFAPSFTVPLQYIQRDSFKWNFTFMGVLSTLTSVAGIIGYLIYGKISEKINIKKWIITSTVIGATTSLAYLYFTPVSAIVYGIVFSLIGAIFQLLILDFMAKKTVKGLEAATFAFFCGINNLGGTLSNLSGAWLLHSVGLKYLIIISTLFCFTCLLIINKINFKEE